MAPLVLSHRQRLELEPFASHAHVAKERCRTLALLWLDDGESAERVAELLHVGRRTVYDRVDRYHDRAGLDLPQRLADAPRPGRPRAGGEGVDRLIAGVIDTDPRDLGCHATVWTAGLLSRHLRDRQGLGVSRKAVSRALARLDLRWERPRHRLALRPEAWRQSKGG